MQHATCGDAEPEKIQLRMGIADAAQRLAERAEHPRHVGGSPDPHAHFQRVAHTVRDRGRQDSLLLRRSFGSTGEECLAGFGCQWCVFEAPIALNLHEGKLKPQLLGGDAHEPVVAQIDFGKLAGIIHGTPDRNSLKIALDRNDTPSNVRDDAFVVRDEVAAQRRP